MGGPNWFALFHNVYVITIQHGLHLHPLVSRASSCDSFLRCWIKELYPEQGASLSSFQGRKGKILWERGTQLPEMFLNAKRCHSCCLLSCQNSSWALLFIKTPLFLPCGSLQTDTPMVCSFFCLIFATLYRTTGIWHLLFPLSRRRFPLLLSKERHPHSLNINLPPIFSSRFSHRSSFPFIYSHCLTCNFMFVGPTAWLKPASSFRCKLWVERLCLSEITSLPSLGGA